MDSKPGESRHITVRIDRPANDVYRYAADPSHLPDWAAGLAQGEVTKIGNSLVMQSQMGPVTVTFAPANDFGVLDHLVTVAGADPVLNPLRVLPLDEQSSEVVFSLRRRPGMSDAEYEDDASAVAADLATLKQLMEERCLD